MIHRQCKLGLIPKNHHSSSKPRLDHPPKISHTTDTSPDTRIHLNTHSKSQSPELTKPTQNGKDTDHIPTQGAETIPGTWKLHSRATEPAPLRPRNPNLRPQILTASPHTTLTPIPPHIPHSPRSELPKPQTAHTDPQPRYHISQHITTCQQHANPSTTTLSCKRMTRSSTTHSSSELSLSLQVVSQRQHGEQN